MLKSSDKDEFAKCRTIFNESISYLWDFENKRFTNETCPPNFDKNMCWNSTEAGTMAYLECPFYLCPACNISFTDRTAKRLCLPNGTWYIPDYSSCQNIFYNMSYCMEACKGSCLKPDEFRDALRISTLVLSLLSTLFLCISVLIFSSFQSIQCRRLTVHKHLATAFILRFITVTIWILSQMSGVFQPCSGVPLGWLCKSILFLLMYSTMASTFWMFVEGAYLVSRFTILAMRSSEGHIGLYILVGWVLPFFFVLSWAVSLEMQPVLRHTCWLPYSTNSLIWLLVAPTGFALGFNVLFLLVVIIILVIKLQSPNTTESATIWKAIKATLLLVPLLGVSNLLLFFEPDPRNAQARQIYMLFAAILQHSQGIFVAVLYCFINSEVQQALHRWLKKWPPYSRYCERKGSKTYATVAQTEIAANREKSTIDPCNNTERMIRKNEFNGNQSVIDERQAMVKECAIDSDKISDHAKRVNLY